MSQVFAAGLFVVEEKLLGDYYLDPLRVVGLEGMWGLIYYTIALPIFQAIHCTGSLCTNGHLEDTQQAFEQIGSNAEIGLECVGICVSIALFNAFGVTVTKYASSPQRSTIDTSRTVVIWVFFMLVGGPLHEDFVWLELLGFILLVAGTLVYNEIVIVPFFGMDQNTKGAIEKRNN